MKTLQELPITEQLERQLTKLLSNFKWTSFLNQEQIEAIFQKVMNKIE